MKEITIKAAKSLLSMDKSVQLIDVRSPAEHHDYDIGGTLIPLPELAQRLDELDKDRVIIVYCQAGVRSLWAADMLQAAGFAHAYSLTGGLAAWRQTELS